MGVPGLFSFLRRRYPQICSPVEKRKGDGEGKQHVDNLYIDMNHIIHSCTHAHVAKDRPEISTTEMFAGMAAYLQLLLDLLEPRRTVMIAIDGVAPRAKMNQQRTRRFLSAYVSSITDKIEAEVRREMVAEAGGQLDIPDVERFDSNIITPGTNFMLQLADWLMEWAAGLVASDARFKHCTFILSDASEPGEGEHKIMRYVRQLKQQPGYDPNTTHVVYGQDADLLLLSLLCHEPYFTVMRENMEAGTAQAKDGGKEDDADLEPMSAVQLALKQQQQEQQWQRKDAPPAQASSTDAAAVAAASHGHLHLPFFEKVDIGVLRECLQWEFSELVGPPGPPGTYGSNEDSDAGSATAANGHNGYASNPAAALQQRHTTGTALAADQRTAVAGVDSDSSGDDLDGLLRLAISDPVRTVPTDSSSARQRGLQQSPGSAGSGSNGVVRSSQRGQKGLRFEALLDDLVVLSFLAGNDFLPNVPSIDIYDKPCGLDLLFSAYKALLPKMGGHITGGGSINRSRLVQLMVFLARDEEQAYKRRSDYRQRRAAQQRNEQAAATADFYSLFDGGLSMGELPPGMDVEKLDKLLQQLGPDLAQELGLSAALAANRAAGVDLRGMSPGQLCEELHNRVAARVKERLMGGDPWAQDPVGMHLPGFRERYYEMRFPELYHELDGDIDKVASRVAWEYMEGMNWVLRYYACGPAALEWRQQQPEAADGSRPVSGTATCVDGASWSWCYSHHYAPLMQVGGGCGPRG